MAFNLILRGKHALVKYFTDLPQTLSDLGIDVRQYDWFVSDIETNRGEDVFATEDAWWTGPALAQALTANIQFIYAVFSAFPPGQRVRVERAPIVYDNENYWNGAPLKPQLHGARFEIACWDSSATFLIQVPADAAERFRQRHPQALPLP